MNKKKEIIRTIRNFKRILKSGNVKTILVVSDWDIYIKTYTIEEIAARFLRIKGYNVQIIRSTLPTSLVIYDSIVMPESSLILISKKMNAKDQRKLCKAGYTILRRHDYPQPHITFKSDINPDSWKRYGDNYPSKAERDRAMKRLLTDDKIVED